MDMTAGGSPSQGVKHPSIIALLAAHPGETNARNLIRRLARDRIALAKRHGWPGPPFCPKILASLFGIRCKEVQHDIGSEGRILPYPDGSLWIEYRSGRSKERQRFTIFHEFAHTLFPDFSELVPHRYSHTRKPFDPEDEFEKLCDIGASEMLLPIPEFHTHIHNAPVVCCETIRDLSALYVASPDATIRRFVEIHETLGCAAVFLTDQKGDYSGRGPLWVQYCLRSSLFKSFFPPGTTPPWNSVAVQCLKNGVAITSAAKETWWISQQPRSYLVQALKLPNIPEAPDYPKVVALILPSGYKLNAH
jgi:hypothetical protein